MLSRCMGFLLANFEQSQGHAIQVAARRRDQL
jgi:hypothetical protein